MKEERQPCPNQKVNDKDCTCPKKAQCPRGGICCQCVMHHRAMGKTPQCFRV